MLCNVWAKIATEHYSIKLFVCCVNISAKKANGHTRTSAVSVFSSLPLAGPEFDVEPPETNEKDKPVLNIIKLYGDFHVSTVGWLSAFVVWRLSDGRSCK